ncbi:MAG: DnaA regulatory inactivator Hda [Burkholderiaceae bacterium]|jgi:DnaA family protein|nr:DnaA regulatory inactivator Hda [Burkholderiaceae bacterium]
MKQLALDIGLVPEPTLAGFLTGGNAQAVQHLRLWTQGAARSPVPIYLWGPPGTGKTHLLRAARQALLEQGAALGWLDATASPGAPFDESWDAVLMDDVHLYGSQAQHTAFNWFVHAAVPAANGRSRAVLAAGALPPADLPLREDLRTRLGWGHVFELHTLPESELRAVLRQAADARGVFLSDEVMSYVLARFARDLGSLMRLLEQLDRYALRTQRAITIPLIKSMLEND